MTDDLKDKHARNRAQRLAWIDQWAEFVANAEEDSVWGDQLNALVDAQIEAAQQVDDCVLAGAVSWEWRTRRPGGEGPD